jgi:hypothetical protein
MTDAQKRYVDLANELELNNEKNKLIREEMEGLQSEIGVNTMFQSEEGLVYQIVEVKGKYVYFSPIDYIRTKRPDETKGDLSMKKAEEAGFKPLK